MWLWRSLPPAALARVIEGAVHGAACDGAAAPRAGATVIAMPPAAERPAGEADRRRTAEDPAG